MLEMMAELLRNGNIAEVISYINVDNIKAIKKDKKFQNFVNFCAQKGFNEIIQALSNHDISRKVLGRSMHSAVQYGQKKTVDLLLELGAPVNLQDRNQELPIHIAVRANETPDSNDILNALINSGSKLNARNKYNNKPIQIAALSGNTKSIKTLIAAGAQKNPKHDLTKETLLHFATASGNIHTVLTVLEINEKLNDKDINKNTPLHIAVRYNYGDIIALLITKGAKLDEENKILKETPLDLAIIFKNPSAIRALIEGGSALHRKGNPSALMLFTTIIKNDLRYFEENLKKELKETFLWIMTQWPENHSKKPLWMRKLLGEPLSLEEELAQISLKTNISIEKLRSGDIFNHNNPSTHPLLTGQDTTHRVIIHETTGFSGRNLSEIYPQKRYDFELFRKAFLSEIKKTNPEERKLKSVSKLLNKTFDSFKSTKDPISGLNLTESFSLVFSALDDSFPIDNPTNRRSMILLFFNELYSLATEYGNKSSCFGGCYNGIMMFAFNQGIPGVFVLIDTDQDLMLALERLSSMFDPKEIFERLNDTEQEVLLNDENKITVWITELHKKFKNYLDKTPAEAFSFLSEHYEKIEKSFSDKSFVSSILKTREAIAALNSLSTHEQEKILETRDSFSEWLSQHSFSGDIASQCYHKLVLKMNPYRLPSLKIDSLDPKTATSEPANLPDYTPQFIEKLSLSTLRTENLPNAADKLLDIMRHNKLSHLINEKVDYRNKENYSQLLQKYILTQITRFEKENDLKPNSLLSEENFYWITLIEVYSDLEFNHQNTEEISTDLAHSDSALQLSPTAITINFQRIADKPSNVEDYLGLDKPPTHLVTPLNRV